MTLDWQTFAAYTTVTVAVAYLLRRLWRRLRAPHSISSGCSGCSAGHQRVEVKPLVQIQLSGPPNRTDR